MRTFAIATQDDLVALFALLAVSLIGSQLSHLARRRADEAVMLAQQRNEAELARKNAEVKSALVASLSHDLKTPLTALTVAAGNLSLGGLSDTERREQREIVQTEFDRLQRLFDNVIEMASVEALEMHAELEWVHPIDIVDAGCTQAAVALGSRTIEVRDSTDRLVHLDPRFTSAALAHVLENAAAYSPASTPVVVDARIVAETLVLAVRDRGPGLPPQDVDRIFERFYRATGATAPNRFGSGMGLAITRGLLEIQGGRITAANHPDGGALFTLEIPAATRAAAEVALDVA